MPASRQRSSAMAGLAALCLASVSLAVGSGSAHADAPAATDKSVSYLGHQFRIPGGWPVVDLTADPTACVRFDQHALYLGTPGADQDCPAEALGRTEAVLVQPLPSSAAAQGTVDQDVSHQIVATAADIRVTGTYDTDKALVQSILASAALPTRTPTPTPTPTPTLTKVAPEAQTATATAAAIAASSTDYTGKGFDTCAAPSAGTMAAWKSGSPYGAVGIYIGGADRSCTQPNLTASWVKQQATAGWHFMPLYVGLQADQITSAAGQGKAAADDAITQAESLGFGTGVPLYFDMEQYSSGYRSTVLAFLGAWTKELHAKDFESGVYSSASSGMTDLVNSVSGSYLEPDVIFDAHYNGSATTADPDYIPAADWSQHQRIHQYSGNVSQTYGGVTVNVDQDILDVDVSVAPAAHSFYHELRNTNGTWTGFKPLHGVGTAPTFAGDEEAIAAMPDGSAQVLGIGENGYLYHEVRNQDGSWSGFTALDGLDGNPNFAGPDVAITGLPDGSSQVVGIGNNNELYFRIRGADGTWTPFSLIPGNGGAASMSAKKVAVAGMPDGSSQVLAYGSDGKMYLDIRSAAGSWSGWSLLAGAAGAAYFSGPDLAITALPDGSSQILAIGLNGFVYHEVRSAAGVYTGFGPVSGVTTTQMGASAVSIAGMPDGTAQVAVVGTDGNVWHRVRNTDGTWTAWGKPGTFAADQVGIAGFPDGTSQILATSAD
ncbi:glycoside hydrolase domain-containing protein [Streptacidiphilus sp. N1-3]|uniref:Glycoside hydrolase domain-containing protein n=1 Tax=Streptacidiphilus alkalitolerans TaxID=3342712 RepID=A0ABV6WYJ5_9ACTN